MLTFFYFVNTIKSSELFGVIMNPNSTHVELQWTDSMYATVLLHAAKNDCGVLTPNPHQLVLLDVSTEDLAWKLLNCFIHHRENGVFPSTVSLPCGTKLDVALWVPLSDALFTVVEVYQLGMPVIID